jgi:hypothetical protein
MYTVMHFFDEWQMYKWTYFTYSFRPYINVKKHICKQFDRVASLRTYRALPVVLRALSLSNCLIEPTNELVPIVGVSPCRISDKISERVL